VPIELGARSAPREPFDSGHPGQPGHAGEPRLHVSHVLHLLHLSFSGLACDEASHARAVAEHLGRALVVVEAPRAPAERFADLALGSPRSRFEPTGVALERAAARGRALGARVVLTGWGGDELFDYKGHEVAEALRDGRIGEALSVVLGPREGALPTLSLAGARELVMMGVRPLLPERLRAPLRRLARRTRAGSGEASAERRFPFLAPALARAVDARREARLAAQRELRGSSPARRAIGGYLEGHGDLLVSLRDIDFSAAASGVEYRHPFYDRRVIELSLSFPHHARARVGASKLVLRDAMRGLLPRPVLSRADKAEFSPYWAEATSSLFRALSGRIASGRLAARGIIDAAYVERALARSPPLGGEHDHLGFLSEVLSLELWLTYHDARGHDGSF
jgi:asparagine synthase (glutamine-hydrolysing)